LGDLISALVSLAVAAGVAFGVMALFPRSRRGLLQATATVLLALTLLTALGSALVGPLELWPMLVWGPFTIVCAVVWHFWKIRPQQTL